MEATDRPQNLNAKKKSGFSSFIQSILNEAAEFKGWEFIFQTLMYAFLIWAIYNLKILYEFHNSTEFADIPKYSIYDFKLSLIMVAVFLGYKNACIYLFFNFVRNRLDPVKYKTDEQKDKRAMVGSIWISHMIYYTTSSVAAFVLFKDQDFFPKLLGGKGEPSNMFRTMPTHPDIPYGVEFYMIQFGSHLHTLIDYCAYRWRDPNFWEMFLHHSLAVFLIFFSYATNNISVGIMVLFVHDPCDVCLYINRLMSDFKYNNLYVKGAIYCTFVYVWIYLRLFAFPKCIIKACFDFINSYNCGIMYSPFLFMTLMLTALVVLHCYWLVVMLRLLAMLVRGKAHWNIYDSAKDSKNKEVEADGAPTSVEKVEEKAKSS